MTENCSFYRTDGILMGTILYRSVHLILWLGYYNRKECINRQNVSAKFFHKKYREVAKSSLTLAKKPKAPTNEFFHFYLLNGLNLTF